MKKKLHTNICSFKLLFLTIVLIICVNFSFAQPKLPQRIITVTATQSLNFGTLYATGAGGTVTVGWDGTRTSTGSISLLSLAPSAQPAIFQIKLCKGRNVTITFLLQQL